MGNHNSSEAFKAKQGHSASLTLLESADTTGHPDKMRPAHSNNRDQEQANEAQHKPKRISGLIGTPVYRYAAVGTGIAARPTQPTFSCF